MRLVHEMIVLFVLSITPPFSVDFCCNIEAFNINHQMVSLEQYNLATHPVKDTVELLTALLEKITYTNDQLRLENDSSSSTLYTCFHSRSIPSISIHGYFTRILKYCPCANECLIALLVYFDQMTQPLQINSYNIHRLIITGLMISSKLYSDVFFTNTRYAKVGGLPVSELNALELEFLRLNNYELYVRTEKLQKYGDNVLQHWNHSRDVSGLAIKDVEYSSNIATTDTNASNHSDEIEGSFNRLTMENNNGYKYPPNTNTSPTMPTTPTSPISPTSPTDSMDKQWRFSRPNFSLK